LVMVPQGKPLPDDFAAPTADQLDGRSFTESTLATWDDRSGDQPPTQWHLIELKPTLRPLTPP